MNDREFSLFQELIFNHCSIVFNPDKKNIYTSKIKKRMDILKISCFSEYYELLKKDITNSELTLLINFITTNKTHFFRENGHFDFISKKLKNFYNKKGNILIWCAGCSTGEEPYSLAIRILEDHPLLSGKIKILATDISTKVLNQAIEGLYTIKELDGIPKSLILKYFIKDNLSYKIKENVKKLIHFRYLNLTNTFPLNKKYDFILCRNVMIYFDDRTISDLAGRFYKQLNEGGYFMTGHSESLKFLETPFKYIEPSIYKVQTE